MPGANELRFLQGIEPAYSCTCISCGNNPAYKQDCAGGGSMDYSANGGDAGLVHSYAVTVICDRQISVWFDRDTTVPDQLEIRASNDVPVSTRIYLSNCGTGIVTSSVTVPANTVSLRVEVTPHCTGSGSTLWSLSISDP